VAVSTKRRSIGKRASRAGELRRFSASLRKFALAFPEATEDFPWGDRVAKVRGKIFVSLGLDPVPGGGMTLTVKLPLSSEAALDLPFVKPMGYGLGKSGWVTATIGPTDHPPLDILKAWIAESYRAVAPRKLVAGLDAR
jgi:predicted DNA-binding protein (MmcQ/YjbR family)